MVGYTTSQSLPGIPYAYDWWHKAKVVPVESRTYLGRANETLATRTCPSGCGPEDWQFILERADTLDSNWESSMELIRVKPAEALQKLEAVLGRHFTQKDVAGILDGFRLTELNQVPTVERVFAQVAPRLFDEDSLDRASAIRFVQIAAKLNVNYPKSVPVWFLCVDDKWRAREDGLLASSGLDLPTLLPEDWLRQHLISPEYESGLSPSEQKVWRQWATNPQKGGLTAFPLPIRVESRVAYLSPAFFRARGVEVPPEKFSTKLFHCVDRIWPKEISDHWEKASGCVGSRHSLVKRMGVANAV